jgi:hypothetical protein
MVSKILSYLLALIILFLIIGIGLQYYVSEPKNQKKYCVTRVN